MKTKRIFRNTFFASILLSGILLMSSCEKDDDNDINDDTYAVSGDASGSQENPAVTTSGTATLSGTYNASSNKLDYTINWTGISGTATMIHFHAPASVGVNASVITDLTISTNGISGQSKGSVTLSETEESYLLSGQVYYNIHTLQYPDGEIRGQVITSAN